MSPVFIVNVGFSSDAIPGSAERDTKVKMDVIFYPNEVPNQSGRLVETFLEPWEGDLSRCRRKEVNEKTELAILKSNVVSREYPLVIRSWNVGLPFDVGQWKGRRT